MEQLNSVTLRGVIGSVRVTKIGDTEMVRLSVATNYSYTAKDGYPVIETTWHQVVALKNDRMPDFSALVTGAGVEVDGRLRNVRYTDAEGVDRTYTEVLASRIGIVSRK